MTLAPVPPVTRIVPARALPTAPPAPLAPQTGAAAPLRLLPGVVTPDEVLGRGEAPLLYRLASPGDASLLQAGQTLLVQVMRTGPPLEVRLLGSVPSGAGGDPGLHRDAEADLPAMRPDQAAILRLAAAASQAKAQAAHWRQLALALVREAGTVPAGAPAMVMPATVRRDIAQVAPDAEPAVLLPAPPWHGWPLTLWLSPRLRAYGGENRRARRRQSTRLGLSLRLPGWGSIGLQLDVLDLQVGLNMVATQPETALWLREQIGAIAARLGKAGLRLMRCHVHHAPDFAAPAASAQPLLVPEHELQLALFRAAAETLEVLRAGTRAGTEPAPSPFA